MLQESKPLISVIMPVYNGEAYLSEALDSVLGQTYTDFEFLIINDGSSDGTQDIIDSYSDSRIRCVWQSNAGVANALNKGLSVAKGTYIWRHDADDTCVPEQLQTQLTFLETHTDVALVGTQIAFMTDRGKIAHRFRQPKTKFFKDKSYITVKREHFNPYSPITHATVLMKKDVIMALGGYRSEFKTSEDTDLWLRLIEQHKAAVLNYCSYFVRLNASSATQVYKGTNKFYRDLAFQFADQRTSTGLDMLQRGEPMPQPVDKDAIISPTAQKSKGGVFRADILNFKYKVAVDAKDLKNIFKDIKLALRDGWRLKSTYRAILFPILGDRWVERGVRLKKSLPW